MRIARTLEEAAAFAPSAVTIGNFDGVHAGHKQLIDTVVEAARERGVHPVVLSFDPHPAAVVAPGRKPRLLTTQAQRCELIERENIESVVILPFTAEFSRLTPEEFAERVLAKALGARVVVVGENFCFGYRQSGDTEVLADLGLRLGFETRVLPPVKRRGRIVSSSEIRRAVESGRVQAAARQLERPYAIEGEVISGRGVGSKQTVPTLNLHTTAQVMPAHGVYITRTRELGDRRRHWNSLTNIGNRPTFGGGEVSIETYLLDHFEDPAPIRISVEFLHRLRDEKKFDTPESLKTQILRDVGRAQTYLRRSTKWIRSSRS